MDSEAINFIRRPKQKILRARKRKRTRSVILQEELEMEALKIGCFDILGLDYMCVNSIQSIHRYSASKHRRVRLLHRYIDNFSG